MKWQSKEQMLDLLCSLVEIPSVTNSGAELTLVEYLYYQLIDESYFKGNPDHLQLHPLEDGRHLLTALVKNNPNKETIVLLSHFDVVGVEDYGSWKNLAFHPKSLTQELLHFKEVLPSQAREDLESGNWLFGRGTMDMKAGLTIHLSILERAMNGEFDGNILLLTVPDEEVNSLGMLTALPALKSIAEKEKLNLRACINGEPMFSQYPGDHHYYLYTGSIGKVLPGFYCYGKETHVGEPFAGMNANLMISYLSQYIELSENFVEENYGEKTPPPVSLMQRDLKEEYSVQTPVGAVAMYNMFYMQQSLQDLTNKLLEAANQASLEITKHYHSKVKAFHQNEKGLEAPKMNIKVLSYEELYKETIKRHGETEVKRRLSLLQSHRNHGDRDFSTLLVQELSHLCKDLAPMIVLFYSPPFYPAVHSGEDQWIQDIVSETKINARKMGNYPLEEIHYFPGLSDLSFIGPSLVEGGYRCLTENMPLYGRGFKLPENITEMLTMPILNIGPLGRDPHQWTERLEVNYSFEVVPDLLAKTLKYMFGN
ncbi:M20/M25/M40 family metallo-hydrolase [Bacillaceae bacterium S4-13-58]